MSRDIVLRDSSTFIEAQHAGDAAKILSGAEFETVVNEKGDITCFYFDGCDMPDDEELCRALAPFMREGSFLEFCDGLGNLWRWVFNNGNCGIVYAVVLWPKPDAPPDIRQQIHKAFAD